MDYFSILAAFSMGLLGGAHCVGMCGGIIGALTMAVDSQNIQRRWLLLVLYNIGRIASYVIIAILFYSVVHSLETYFSFTFMRYVAGCLLIAMGLYLGGWWQGLVYLERIGSVVWRRIQPFSRSLVPVKNNWQALVLGMIWGWLPCGLIYSALAYSSTAVSLTQSALIMLGFALGTLPALILSGLVAERLLLIIKNKVTRSVMAIIMIMFGVWTLMNNHSEHHHVSVEPEYLLYC